MEEKQEKKQSWQFVKWIFKVLYSPMKTFEEIVKKPNVKGPILILLITLPITLSGQYVSGTKFFLETPTPKNDLWTEEPSNSPPFLWTPNENVTFDSNDYIVGNYSVSTSLINSSLIWVHLTNIGSFNCSKEAYSRLSFRIKWMNEANVTPTNATLQLFSFNNESNRFELDIESLIANNSNVWANITVSLATNSWREVPENLPSWENVTGVGFRLMWPNSTNLALKVDGLFFGKYELLGSINVFSVQLVNSLIGGVADFILNWLLLAGLLLLVLKTFSDWKGSWKSELYVVGYVYSASWVHLLVYVLLLFLLPPLFIPYNVWHPFSGEEARASELLSNIYESGWGGQPVYMLVMSWNFIFYIWTALLCAVALKKMHDLPWMKVLLISVSAFMLSILFRAFIPI